MAMLSDILLVIAALLMSISHPAILFDLIDWLNRTIAHNLRQWRKACRISRTDDN